MRELPSTIQPIFANLSVSENQKIAHALALITPAEPDIASAPTNLRPKGLDVATLLAAVHLDVDTLVAALLSDSRIESGIDNAYIQQHFGETVAALVNDVQWLNKNAIYTLEMAQQPSQSEILRRMLLAMTHDVRAVLIKLAYRIQRLRNLNHEAPDIAGFIAQETLDIYAPLANRLGISQFKWELEDLSFRCLDPDNYFAIVNLLAQKREQRDASIARFKSQLHAQLQAAGLSAEISGRPKHIFSIWNKMRSKHRTLDELYDLLAVRVVVDNLAHCYSVLGVAHSHWQSVPKEFDDYIANPKENGYQSLHTVVLDDSGNRIEIQIRSHAMHAFAELGVAAHWRYKEGRKFDAATQKNIASLRQLLEEKTSGQSLLDDFHTELFSDRVFVLTPAGKLIDLIKGATPLDFAYAIHTSIGHSCRGAKVNGQIKPLNYPLRSGEQIEIITVKNGHPNHNWLDPHLGYLHTPRAISRVKSWFKQQQQADNIAAGKQVVEKHCKRLGLKSAVLDDLIKHFKVKDSDQLYEAIGHGDINPRQLAAALTLPELEPAAAPVKRFSLQHSTLPAISVGGVDGIVTRLAHCCSPVNGDPIIGFITHNRGITIHRQDCETLQHLPPEHQHQLLEATWQGNQPQRYRVPIVIEAQHGTHLLVEVTQLLAAAKVPISDANLKTDADAAVTLQLVIHVESTAQLSQLLARISHLPQVLEVTRKVER